MSGLPEGLWAQFLSYLFQSQEITVPSEFHDQAKVVSEIFGSDGTGVVSSIINYAINSASEAKFKVECSNETIEELLSLWLENININLNGIPTGLNELSKEYYKEIWAGSSLCLLRVSGWKTITIGANSIKVPTVLWFVNGSSVWIKREDETNYKLGSDLYFLDKAQKLKLPKDKEEDIVIQKPFGRWFTKYPTPYLIQSGVYKNWKALEVLQNKSNEVISKVLPYLFLIEKGDKDAFLQKDVDYTDGELQIMVNNFKEAAERYNNEKGKLPVAGIPFDQKYSHLIPELKNILSEELYRQGYRAILAGLGFISVVQGVGDSRKEEVINPKPFIAKVNAGIDGFKAMLIDVIKLIIDENKTTHRKLFSDNKSLKIVSSPIKLNIDTLLDYYRSGYIYGTISVQSYQEILGIDPEQELERMKKEWKDGLRELYYPHLIQNTEDKGIDTNISPAPITKKQQEKQNEKTTQPDHMQEAIEKTDLEIAPYTKENHPKYLDKYPQDAVNVWITTFNDSLPKGEDYAFPVAWTVMKKYLKRHYKKEGDKWVKKGESK